MPSGTRLLIVDDDPSLADLMANQLSELREAFSIRVETDPHDALDAVEVGTVDCVLSDYQMPEMNGLELLRYVREMEPGIPFILFTSQGSEEIASEVKRIKGMPGCISRTYRRSSRPSMSGMW